MDRRLRRLQERLAPQENEEVRRLVELLRERRRRRAEACGEHLDDPPQKTATRDRSGFQSISEILRSRYARRLEIATDINE
jgi:hypothetical protein